MNENTKTIDYQKLYNENWSNYWGDDAYEMGPIILHRFKFILCRSINAVNPKSILDVGCGNGSLLNLLSKQYPEIELHGADVSEIAIEKARSRGVKCNLSTLNLQNDNLNKKFEMVVCSDVLEHLEDDEKAIQNLGKMGDWVFISVPSGKKMDRLDKEWGHLRLYSRKDLKQKLEKNGFHVESIRQWGWPLYGPYRALKRITPQKIQQGENGKFGFVQILLSRILYYMFFICMFDKGSHLFALAKKKG